MHITEFLWYIIFFIHVDILDSFLINPETKTVQEGSSTTLFCVHSGSLPAASISWTKDGITLTDSSPRFTITAGILSHADPPQTTSSLSISPLAKTDSGDYACVATNSLLPNEAVHSSSSILTVLGQLYRIQPVSYFYCYIYVMSFIIEVILLIIIQ